MKPANDLFTGEPVVMATQETAPYQPHSNADEEHEGDGGFSAESTLVRRASTPPSHRQISCCHGDAAICFIILTGAVLTVNLRNGRVSETGKSRSGACTCARALSHDRQVDSGQTREGENLYKLDDNASKRAGRHATAPPRPPQ